MRHKKVLFCILIIFTAVIFSSCASSPDYVKKGDDATASKKYNDAINYYTKAINLDNKNAKAFVK